MDGNLTTSQENYPDLTKTEDKKRFMERFKEQRKYNKYTMERLASIVGLSKSAISALENGRFKNIKHSTLKLVANAFRCTEDYLLGKSDSPERKENGLIQPIFIVTEDRFLPLSISDGLTNLAKRSPNLAELLIKCNDFSDSKINMLSGIIKIFVDEFSNDKR